MIITRTPFRISFFGGGTDYPNWYLDNGGCVLSTSIDKYCYLSVRYLPKVFEKKHRFVYSKIEQCQHNHEIQHPAIRECLKYLNFSNGLEIFHQGDLPARSGMATSSAYVVGLLNAHYSLLGIYKNKNDLFLEAIHIEQNLMNENVGSQDQVATTVGGLNYLEFQKSGNIIVNPLPLLTKRKNELNSNLHLFYTGIQRNSGDYSKQYIKNLKQKRRQLRLLKEFVKEGVDILSSTNILEDFGHLLHENWLIKKTISECISNKNIDSKYLSALEAGAIGGKMLGAGGGGFLLLYITPDKLNDVKLALNDYKHVPFEIENEGTKILYHLPCGEVDSVKMGNSAANNYKKEFCIHAK